MESYIVRIYRREGEDVIVGVVEEALSRRKMAFHSILELSEWLRRPRRGSRHRPFRDAGNARAGPCERKGEFR